MTWRILQGDCVEQMATMPAASVDAVVCDPPYNLGFMSRPWDMQHDHEPWSREALRVLKPGGHLLAFGGTRTYHRLACAIEDAGFEIRDTIAWLYGSGFPKSLDVSKAIDKAAGAQREVVGSYDHRSRLDGSNRQPVEDYQGSVYTAAADAWRQSSVREVSNPATPEAQQWEGWGTALKPAHEPIVVARKPLSASGVNVRAAVENALRARGVEGEITWTNGRVSDVAQPDQRRRSSSTDQRPAAGTSAGRADVNATPSDEQPTVNDSAPNIKRGGTPIESTFAHQSGVRTENSERPSSLHTAAPAPAAGSDRPSSSPSTTSTAVEPRTVGQSTARSTASSDEKTSPPATESFAGIATGLTGSRAHVHINRLSDGTFAWPDGLPLSVPGGSTVAANVLEHGTGALNVDGCRIEHDGSGVWGNHGQNPANHLTEPGSAGTTMGTGWNRPGSQRHDAGRWPANLLLDPEAAELLDAQTGELQSGWKDIDKGTDTKGASFSTSPEARTGQHYGDSGGASRFFYTAKSSRAERNAGLDGFEPTGRTDDGYGSIQTPKLDRAAPRENWTPHEVRNSHPTVKPIALMRWLVRLVTPPGGTCLDPFTGSGTTGIAAVLEGFGFIGIEREPEYVAIAEARIAYWAAQPVQLSLEEAA